MPFLITILIVLAALLALVLFLVFPALRRHPDRKMMQGLIIAHRGLHSIFKDTPENSLPAFEAAAERGIAIEIDIHITRDGKVVVFHDDTLDRMCGVSGIIEEKTLSELKELSLGGTNHKIPTLYECLRLVDGRVPLMIEFKTKSPKTCAPLCRAANEILKNYKGKYFMQSFYPPAVMWYRRHRKDICRGQLSSGYFKEKGIHMKALSCLLLNFLSRPDFVAYEYKYESNPFRRLCVLLGAHSSGWTFTDKENFEKYSKAFPTRTFENFLPEN
ncbi:MAG: glycerophosphodiester phosphodiesterase family protein [Oscillospiraceae bacterium]|nr:glycerophosphodiester phosphodiesterase family protein [Oscillospiraceae bacterium]